MGANKIGSWGPGSRLCHILACGLLSCNEKATVIGQSAVAQQGGRRLRPPALPLDFGTDLAKPGDAA